MNLKSLVILSALATTLSAQRTWIVDAGGGGNFKDIQAAFSAARPGDTVLVRKGSYNPAATSKGLRLLGEPGAFISKYPPAPDLISISGLPANQTFVMKGFMLENLNAGRQAALRLTGNLGRVHLESLDLRGTPLSNRGSPALRIENCREVSVTGCTLKGEPALLGINASVSVVNCQLLGQNAFDFRGMYSWRSYYGIEATKSTLFVSWSTVKGGNGSTRAFNLLWQASPAALLSECKTTISGDQSSRFIAGLPPPRGVAMPAILTSGGTLLLDPSVKITPSGNAPPIRGTARITKRRLPALKAGARGSTVTAELYSRSGSLFALYASLPADPLPLPIGESWLDLRFLVLA
ncbi:MAG: hypothetical protein ACE5F1_16925, partial [Planctomycetota bacterium]